MEKDSNVSYRIVRRNNRVSIHRVICDDKGHVVVIDENPVSLSLPDDGKPTCHLDLVGLIMDAMSAHRKSIIDQRPVEEVIAIIEKEMVSV